jgi:arylsulfatase A-like enzyme
MSPRRLAGPLVTALGLALCATGCRGLEPVSSRAIRLTDLYRPPTGPTAQAARKAPRTEWRFDGVMPRQGRNAATWGWTGFNGVADLAVRNGRLVGRATSDLPMLHLARGPGFEEREAVHAVEVRLRVSAGTRLAVELDRSKEVDRDQILDGARHFTWDFAGPLDAGELQTRTLRTQFSRVTADSRNIFVRPTDAPGASFEIESIRLVTRREHLEGVESGLGWQSLSEVYKETLVVRAPDALRFDLTLPPRPMLDLAIGTVEDTPVRFRVLVEPQGGETKEVLERTVTRPHRWEPVPIDLSPWAGRRATLAFALESEQPGAVGFWGSPVVRSLGAMPSATSGPAAVPRPQGVILVWTDTLRRDHLGAYGYGRPTTPVIDRLAREGVLFRDCIGQATWTKVATPSLFTALYPSAHGVLDFMDRLPSSAHTLAEAYREAGYATLSMSSILFTGRFSNLHQGFEEVHEGSSLADVDSSKTAREYVDRLLPWLDAHRETPFFVFLHVSDPHDPYKPASPYDAMWADAARSEDHERQGKVLRKSITDPLLRNMGSLTPTREDLLRAGLDPEEYVRHDRDWYDGSIRGLDAEMGRLVERLRALGLEPRTLLVFTADHGEEFLEHGRMLHGQGVYGELSNMPLFFRGPGIVPAGAEVEATVQAIDLMPTLLEMSRVPVSPGLHGRSLLPLIVRALDGGAGAVRAGEDWTDRPAITEKAATVDNGSPPPRDTESVSIVYGGWKLIHNTKRPAGRPEYELFDHRRDPLDGADVAAQHPDVVQRLRRELDAWRKSVFAARLKPDAEVEQSLSAEERERLRALGYVQ